MRIKGSIEFSNVLEIKKNLEKLIEQKGDCSFIACEDCIFNVSYATSGFCTNNTVFKMKDEKSKLQERLRRAREILAEIEEIENDR
jgi:hypothetical protein